MELLHKGCVTRSYEAGVVSLSITVSVQAFSVAGVDAPVPPISSTSAHGEADKRAPVHIVLGVLHVLCPLVPQIPTFLRQVAVKATQEPVGGGCALSCPRQAGS